MSIAVSAVVHPSRVVLCLTLAMCLGSVSIGILFGIDASGSIMPFMRTVLGALCVMAGMTAAYLVLRKGCARRSTQRIDISGNGQIRVHPLHAVQVPAGLVPDRAGSPDHLQELLPSSTMWSHLMVLNLRAKNNGTKSTLLILPDSMSQTSFRALSVACHWIAAHNNRAEREIK